MADSKNIGPINSSKPIDISSASGFRKKAANYDQIFNETDLEIIELRKRYRTLNSTIDAIVDQLKEYIIGQDQALKILTFLVFNNLYLNLLEDTCGIVVEHINGLVIGPSGSGKTATLRALAKIFKVPFTYYNATGLTSAGYIGDDVSNILSYHLENCDYDVEKASRGIIYIDEIDKIRSTAPNNTSGRDINGTSVQQELLKILEPSEIPVGKEKKKFDTHMLTVICGGKFEDLESIRKERLHGKKEAGFEKEFKPKKSYDYDDDDFVAAYFDDNLSTEYIPNDLIKYGFINEFVGRFTLYAEFKPLSVADIENIIYAKNSFLQQYLNVFNSRGVDLIVNPKLFTELAMSIAANTQIGARDIKRKLIKLLLPALYDTEQNYCPGICEIDDKLHYTSVFEQRESEELLMNIITDLANRTDLKPNT